VQGTPGFHHGCHAGRVCCESQTYITQDAQGDRSQQVCRQAPLGELEHVHVQEEAFKRVGIHRSLFCRLRHRRHVPIEDGFQVPWALFHQLAKQDLEQGDADHVDVCNVRDIGRRHTCATPRLELDQAFALKDPQRLAHGSPADPEYLADVLLQQSLAGMNQVHCDHAREPHGDLLGHGCRCAGPFVAAEDRVFHRHHDRRLGQQQIAQVGGVIRLFSGHVVRKILTNRDRQV